MKVWMKRLGFVVAVLASVALIAAACGSDEGDGGATGTPPPGATAAPPPGATAAPTAAPPPPGAPVAMTGTIVGSTLIVAGPTIGKTTWEAQEGPYDFSRPGSNVTKDDFFLISPTGELLSHVVKEWDFGAETKHWTLTMRDDIKFPAYDRFAEVDDLVWSIYDGHWTGFKSGGVISRRFQTSVQTIVDTHTLKIDFEEATFGVAFSGMTQLEETVGIYPSREILALGNGDATAGWAAFMDIRPGPQASGAYTYVRQVPAEVNEYEVNAEWFGPAPDFERLEFREVQEIGSLVALLAAERADIATLSAPAIRNLEGLDHAKPLLNPNTVYDQWVFFNLWEEDHPAYDAKDPSPFYDVRVREAFSISINRDEINDVFWDGRHTLHSAMFVNTVNDAWNEPLVQEQVNNPIPYDPARAVQLLQDANFDFSRTIKAADGGPSSIVPEWPELNLAIVTNWIEVLGVDVILETTKENTGGQLHDGNAVRWDLWGGYYVSGTQKNTLGQARHYGPGSVNFGPIFWDDLSVIREKAIATSDFDTYTGFLAEISQYQRDNWSMIPTFIHPIYYGVNSNVVESWPMAGIKRNHYMEHIRATEAFRKAQ